MEIAKAKPGHIEDICAITNQAKTNMELMGINQWQFGYPNRTIWEDDIGRGIAYVVLEGRKVVGMFSYFTEPERAYKNIEGSWLCDGPYATIHRCAVAEDARGRGIIGEIFDFACNKASAEGMLSVRIDTHKDNAPMLSALEKNGFKPCGVITLLDGQEAGAARVAFEKMVV